MKTNKEQYGFITAISMVVGIVIGSGIFFKADDILTATGGSVLLGILGFLVVGIGVVFGSLVISEYAINKPEEGGLIPFCKDAFGSKIAYFVSWFVISVYFPALIVILSFVTAIYLSVLLGIDSNIFLYIATTLVLTFAFISNILSKRVGGTVQSITTGLQLVPLFIIGAIGLIFFNSGGAGTAITSHVTTSNSSFFTALIAIAFTFDGWIVVTSIGGEIKNPRKTLPIALTAGVLLTTIIYILYFIGITNIVSPSDIISLGDGHVDIAAQTIFGSHGSTIITTFVVIAVYGGVNGMVLAYLRLPHAIIEEGMMKDILNINANLTSNGFSKGVITFDIITVTIMLLIQILTNEGIIFGNLETAFDLSTLPITIIYFIYIGLYIRVFRVTSRQGVERARLLMYVIVAVLISLIVIYGAMQVNGLIYIIFSLIAMIIGIPFMNRNCE
ncbi:amino acid permease [Mollicutes bacterium LVI A0078]|nr:amino acid permease [Mollicutes bacterium LVI A0075]WOO91823.1 amino acid permease [Mollicutes bacterium LVI A0078]